jgi:hypothetical protein
MDFPRFTGYTDNMKIKNNTCLCIIGLFVIVVFSHCAAAPHHNFSLKDTLSIFLLNNEKGDFFCVPVQYVGDYQIEDFEFTGGYVLIGDYEILLQRDDVNIAVYLNEAADEYGNSDGEFKLIYREENNIISVSKMSEPLAIKHGADKEMNHYYIFIEKYLENDDMKKIINQYEKGKIYSQMNISYDITIDNEPQAVSGLYDDFELYDGPAIDPAWFPQNLDFFKSQYLQK